MAVSVLVVDDSGFFRKRLSEILGGGEGINVVGMASNGLEAIEMVERLRPDVITMDYEMPVMDGITAVREIMRRRPTPVLMFSSLTYDGARVTLDALEAGAVDFLPKNFEDIARDKSQLQQLLRQRIMDVAGSRVKSAGRGVAARASAPAATSGGATPSAVSRNPDPAVVKPSTPPATAAARPVPRAGTSPRQSPVARVKQTEESGTSSPQAQRGKTPSRHYDVVAIGTSTGGPIALQKVLIGLPASFPAPLVLIQHMPASFTPAFADRLNRLCQITVRQAEDGDVLQAGTALLAPGGMQMMIEKRGSVARVRILPDDGRLNYRPCVDVTFGSLAKHFPGTTLGVILTGMGADGCNGARLMKQTGSIIWSQDEQSSVIYGMPMAVAKAGLSDEVLPLGDFTSRLIGGVR
ncbi:MAG: chemotaxis response regulator protein-glutamate methylesterase [Halomonadaceae bacterium]|nr:MAG: chemotaxis response regulator protein-glutamate methylesterase [Halomonadaceae bacterium]